MTSLSIAELESDVLRVLRGTECTAAELAAVLGTPEQTARAVLGLLAVRGAVVSRGAVQGGLDILGRRQMHTLWRAAHS